MTAADKKRKALLDRLRSSTDTNEMEKIKPSSFVFNVVDGAVFGNNKIRIERFGKARLVEELNNEYAVLDDGSVLSLKTGTTMTVNSLGTSFFSFNRTTAKAFHVMPIVAKYMLGMRDGQRVIPRDMEWDNTHPDNIIVVDDNVYKSIARHHNILKKMIAVELAKSRRLLRQDLGLTVRFRRNGSTLHALRFSRFQF